jgi:hypothetical protein
MLQSDLQFSSAQHCDRLFFRSSSNEFTHLARINALPANSQEQVSISHEIHPAEQFRDHPVQILSQPGQTICRTQMSNEIAQAMEFVHQEALEAVDLPALHSHRSCHPDP